MTPPRGTATAALAGRRAIWHHASMWLRALLLLLTLASPALAETPLSAEAFERYVTGKTLTYAEGGIAYGAEEYLPGRRVRWAFEGDICREGYWYDENGVICFVYEHDPTPQCWTFLEGPRGLIARFEAPAGGRELYEASQSDEPLFCPGPDVGV
jgi:hypothetical protein